MFIDYVTLMLANMAAGLLVLAVFLWRDISAATPDSGRRWAPAMAVPGLIATITGFAMTFTWPLPSPYNIAFGETSVMLGVLFLAASWLASAFGTLA
jgi:putative membrane protein